MFKKRIKFLLKNKLNWFNLSKAKGQSSIKDKSIFSKKFVSRFHAQNKIILGFILIFLITFFLGTWNLGKAGRVWDEEGLLQIGYKHIDHARNLDFGNDFWWSGGAEDHPPLVRYVRGLAGLLDIEGYNTNGSPIFSYDLIHARYVSVALFILTALSVFLFASRYFSYFVGFTSALILAMLPIVIGHSQLIMYEPFNLFFYTISVISYIYFLSNPNKKRIVTAGIFLGLALLSKETNFMIVPMLIATLLMQNKFSKKKNLRKLLLKTLFVFLVGGLTFFVFWPMPFFHLKEFMAFQWELRATVGTSIPEVFFGKLILVPKAYYIVHFLITTPFVILILFLIGLKKIDKSKNWILYTLILWFLLPFIMSFYPKREQGIRYIIQICAPLSLIAAIGFESIFNFFKSQLKIRVIGILALFIYMFVVLIRISPYYIDYFNVLVGGTKNVYEKRLFHLSWWGEGLKEAFEFLQTTPKGSTIGLATSPSHTVPELPDKKVSLYEAEQTYDYVVVNFYHVVRIGFDDTEVRKKYSPIYKVMADGAPIVIVYKNNLN